MRYRPTVIIVGCYMCIFSFQVRMDQIYLSIKNPNDNVGVTLADCPGFWCVNQIEHICIIHACVPVSWPMGKKPYRIMHLILWKKHEIGRASCRERVCQNG